MLAEPPYEIELQPMPVAGRWAVGVSGGADSVALLRLVHRQKHLQVHVVHLDHQLRGESSRMDAEFVFDLAGKLNLPCTVERRDRLEAPLSNMPKNPSARFRALRMELFRRVIHSENLQGVILGHHADDQAETIVQRLLRSSGPAGLSGMSAQTTINSVTIVRPLLKIRRQQLRDYLQRVGQPWREDASNQSQKYLRNRIRQWLSSRPELFPVILDLGRVCHRYAQWIRRMAPQLPAIFPVRELASLPCPLACESARRWLAGRGANRTDLTPGVLERLCIMAADVATPAHQQFPGFLQVRRTGGKISVYSSSR